LSAYGLPVTLPAPKPHFNKPAKAPADLLAHLIGRGLDVPDPVMAEHALRRIGYYRLLIYMRPLQTGLPSKRFRGGVQFGDILALYDFDRHLRLLTLDAIERVEVALRSAVVNMLGIAHGPHFHCDSRHFADLAAFGRLYAIADEATYLAVRHYKWKYGSPPLAPIWAITEALTFGQVSHFFASLNLANRKLVAAEFGFDETVLVSWFKSLSTLRNMCAHHNRLWNATIKVNAPKRAKALAADLVTTDRFYARAVVLQALLRGTSADGSWKAGLGALLASAPSVNPFEMGFPSDWQARSIWR
jgi:abortive infection bacteriophage resistance protein